jgi:hypothetical protein
MPTTSVVEEKIAILLSSGLCFHMEAASFKEMV